MVESQIRWHERGRPRSGLLPEAPSGGPSCRVATASVTFRGYAKGGSRRTRAAPASRDIRPETVADYKRALERHAYPVLGRMRLVDIEPRDVRALVATIERKRLSPHSVRIAIAPVKAMLATAVEDGAIRSNPAAGVRLRTARAGDRWRRVGSSPTFGTLTRATPSDHRTIRCSG